MSYADIDNRPPDCPACGQPLDWMDCHHCHGEGYVEHDCFEDTCCCLDPDDEVCRDCDGDGGYWRCNAQMKRGDAPDGSSHPGRRNWSPERLRAATS